VSVFRWTAAEVERALGTSGNGEGDAEYTGVSTDTRKIGQGSLFVALRGANYDAHDFLAVASEAGAIAAVVSRIPEVQPSGMRLYLVDDTLHALGRLARHRRRALTGRVVAVAGSNGKTTTKELLRAALGARFRVHATEANLNNQVGVPLTLLAAPEDAEVLVVETGTNEPGEIALLGAIAEPDAALITSIGEEHLEGFGSVAGVLEEELAILPSIRPGGTGFVADEPDELVERSRAVLGHRVRIAGFSESADLRPEGDVEVRPDGSTAWRFRGVDVHVPLPGRHNVRNALLALGIAEAFGVPLSDAARGIGAMSAPKMRNEWRRVGSVGVLADCYNSNPPSLRAAVELLASIPSGGAKVAVVGTMRELGDQAEALHSSAAETIAALVGNGIDRVVATGDFVAAFGPLKDSLGDRLVAADDPLQAYEELRGSLRGDETILLKGSRGVALERIIPLIERDFGQDAETNQHAGA
jgi:UDP-N-acetylmuramoyl-tripeptide--D-alanyl-D-alanine ligase